MKYFLWFICAWWCFFQISASNDFLSPWRASASRLSSWTHLAPPVVTSVDLRSTIRQLVELSLNKKLGRLCFLTEGIFHHHGTMQSIFFIKDSQRENGRVENDLHRASLLVLLIEHEEEAYPLDSINLLVWK